MACSFQIKPKQNIDEVYQIALKEIERFGATYKGDETSGAFEVEILGMQFKGTIRVESNIITVSILNKPLLVPCSVIESSVKAYVDTLQ